MRLYQFVWIGLLLCSSCAPSPDAVAPIVVDVSTSGCDLDPSTRYYSDGAGTDGDFVDIYDLSTGEEVTIPEANQRFQNPPRGGITLFWSYPGVLFVGVDITTEMSVVSYFEDGWFFDFDNDIFTDVLDLSAAEREQLLEETNAKVFYARTTSPPHPSPDRRFIAAANTILRNTGWPNGAYEELVVFPGTATVCQNGWKADSSGVYIVEHTGFGGKGGGPIRFLAVPEQYLTPTPAAE